MKATTNNHAVINITLGNSSSITKETNCWKVCPTKLPVPIYFAGYLGHGWAAKGLFDHKKLLAEILTRT